MLRTSKKSKRKQPTTANRVNWSTPNGISRGIPAGNRDYEAVPILVFKDDVGEDPSLRRSRRARFVPLQFWKNEKLIYEAQNEEGILGMAMGDMPVVAFVQKAQPTPYKEVKRTAPEKKKKKDGKRKSGKGGGDSDEGSDGDNTSVSRKPFDDRVLRTKFRVNNGESGKVWSETLESATDTKIVSRIDNRTFSKLPLSMSRKKSESKVVGFASQGFHVPTNDDDLIAGNAVLTPGGSYNNGNMLGGPLKSQVKGWLVPPETGEYVFWIHSNNKGEFWLSTYSHAANKVLLSCKQKSIETRYWTRCTSPLISLVAGHKYYYEVRKLVIFTMF